MPGIAPGAGIAALTTVGYVAFLFSPPIIGLFAGGVGLRSALWIVVVLLGSLAALAPATESRRPAEPSPGRL